MKRTLPTIMLALAALWAAQACAYELTTHSAITFNAYLRSRLGNADQVLFRQYGLDRYVLDPTRARRPFGDLYYDAGVARRSDLDGNDGKPSFEIRQMPAMQGFAPRDDNLTIPGWLMRGAIREDDYAPTFLVVSSPNPQDDPFGNISRPLRHFFDPYFDRPLTVFGFGPFPRATDWATGAVNTFTNPQPDTARRNHFTVYDAREALFRALTLMRRNSDGTFEDLFGGNGIDTVRELEANRYWATTFRSLGDVLHLNQDMAQPQHTRNEPHNGTGPSLVESVITGHASVLEFYTDARAKGASSFKVDVGISEKTVSIGTPRPLNLSGYSIPRLANYAQYFSSGSGSASSTGKGLADFSNREFFTPAHMFGEGTYPLPSSNVNDYGVTVVDPVGWDGQPINNPVGDSGKVSIYTKTVNDFFTNAPVTGSPAFTRSVWDQFMERRSILPTRSLNHIIYDAQVDLLLPRAVAYSAGILD